MGLTIERYGRRAIVGLVGPLGTRERIAAWRILNIASAAEKPASVRTHGTMPSVGDFAKQLEALGDVDAIDLYVASDFGNPFDCAAIYDLLNRHPAKITCTIDGRVAGPAILPCMAADKIRIGEASHIELNKSRLGTFGDSNDLRAVAACLEKLDNSAATIIARRSGRHVSTIADMMENDKMLSGPEAVQFGLADSLLPLKRSPAARLSELAIHNRIYAQTYGYDRRSVAARLREIAGAR
jgi:ATP-dependent protease ClpP protease subunit